MAEPELGDEVAEIAGRLEELEDELANEAEMEIEDIRERISEIRMDLVEAGLEDAVEDALSSEE